MKQKGMAMISISLFPSRSLSPSLSLNHKQNSIAKADIAVSFSLFHPLFSTLSPFFIRIIHIRTGATYDHTRPVYIDAIPHLNELHILKRLAL